MPQIPINYLSIATRFTTRQKKAGVSAAAVDDTFRLYLLDKLPDKWCGAYASMPNGAIKIVQVSDHGYEFLFDVMATRVVAAFGLSGFNPAKRDSSRMKDFLGKTTSAKQMEGLVKAAPAAQRDRLRHLAGLSFRQRFFDTHGDKYDRGHFMSHRQGGGLDINLFPQRADINQGHGVQGAEYRSMEKSCVAHQGVFCFSRPIYIDDTWVPDELEYGVIQGPGRIDVKKFPNR